MKTRKLTKGEEFARRIMGDANPAMQAPPWKLEDLDLVGFKTALVKFGFHGEAIATIVRAVNESGNLLFVLKHRCEFHHVPLHKGWAHVLTGPHGTRTVKCRLSLTERDAIARAECK